MNGVAPTRPSGSAERGSTHSPHAKAVATAFHEAAPTLLHNDRKGRALAAKLKAKPPRLLQTTGTDAKGSVTLAYTFADKQSAKELESRFEGLWLPDDESWVGSNVTLPDEDMMTGFKAVAQGKQLVVTLSFAPAPAE